MTLFVNGLPVMREGTLTGELSGRALKRGKSNSVGGRDMNFYERMGLKPLINASETYTNLGGSLMAEETLEAMREAGRGFVDMGMLMDAVCARAAALDPQRGGVCHQRRGRGRDPERGELSVRPGRVAARPAAVGGGLPQKPDPDL